jgi:hypothetical protein
MTQEPVEQAAISPLAGKPVPKNMLVDIARLERNYYGGRHDNLSCDRISIQSRR